MKYLGIILLLALSNIAISQLDNYVIAGAGEVMVGIDLTIDFTIGEVCVETINYNGIYLTQGYHQPIETNVIDFVYSVPEVLIEIYPNPSQGLICLKIPEYYSFEILKIFDSRGALCLLQRIDSGLQSMDLPYLSTGHYTITLIDTKTNNFHNQTIVIQH